MDAQLSDHLISFLKWKYEVWAFFCWVGCFLLCFYHFNMIWWKEINKMKVIIPSTACRQKKWFFRPLMMSFGFLEVMFGEKGLVTLWKIWSTWNWTWHKFLRENMQAGISNMEDIRELMLWSEICVFRVHKTTVLIPVFKCVQRLKVHALWQKLRENLTKSYLQFK